MLELRGVSKVYEVVGVPQKVLKGVSINFRTSEFAAILGPSGSGKTTLLNIIGGLDHYTDGDIKINEISTKKFRDKDWDSYRNHRIGFVFQSYNLIPHQTVLANVKLALTLSGISKREATKRARQALEDVGLKDHINKRPAQLSGGQMQRVAIARALVNDPDILLADEPTGALDSDTSVQIMELLKKIAKKKLVIMVTHNPELAEQYATRIITLKDGRITSDSHSYDGKLKTNLDTGAAALKQGKTRMSFFTALGLSMRNLLTKKGRTALVAVAGSIGIIGIALIMAVSTGFQGYIDYIQEETLTSYPLMLQRETADVTGTLLSSMLGGEGGEADGLVHENQVLTGTLGSVTSNDLKSFQNYLGSHYDEVKDDVRLIEKEYSVEPLIYTVDATGSLAQLNPNNLFSSLIGGSELLSSYTSVYTQYERENMENDFRVLAGRLPDAYNEVVIVLSEEGKIGDLLTYSLGLHDTKELSEVITKLINGETVALDREPLTLSYEDLMAIELKLLTAADTYKYNTVYSIYEDMTDDAEYMREVYRNAERLKIVGVATVRDDLTTISGVAYLPSLVEHVIEVAAETEIVRQQLASPSVDVFSGQTFGEESAQQSFEFSDLVEINSAQIANAFTMDIDQTAVSAQVGKYMGEIANDIDVNVMPTQAVLAEELAELAEKLRAEIAGLDGTGMFTADEIEAIVARVAKAEDFSEMEEHYVLPKESFAEMYEGMLKGLLMAYIEGYEEMMSGMIGSEMGVVMSEGAEIAEGYGGIVGRTEAMLEGGVVELPEGISLMSGADGDTDENLLTPGVDGDTLGKIPIMPVLWQAVETQYLEATEIEGAFETMAAMITEIEIKQAVLTKVGELTAYLSSSFSSALGVDETVLMNAFSLKYSEEELTRIVTALFTRTESSYTGNLTKLGYQALDDPTYLAVYFSSFEGKTNFLGFIDHYNELMESYGQDEKVIEYADTTGLLMNSVKVIVDAVSYVLIAFVSISLVVSSIMIGVITYISVYERTKEIGVLRAIGASKRNISNIFNAETFIIGLLSGMFGIGVSYLAIPMINAVLHHFTGDIPLNAQLAVNSAVILVALSVVLTLIGGIIPAKAAARKDPVEALRSE